MLTMRKSLVEQSDEGYSMEEPLTNRLVWRFESWNVVTLMGNCGEVVEEGDECLGYTRETM